MVFKLFLLSYYIGNILRDNVKQLLSYFRGLLLGYINKMITVLFQRIDFRFQETISSVSVF